MHECWLKPNRRPAYAALTVAVPLGLASVAGALWFWRSGHAVLAALAALTFALAAANTVWCVLFLRRSRVTYHDGQLFIHDGTGKPQVVPIDIVEVFFLGSGPVKDNADDDSGPRTANVVIRLAESKKEFHQRNIAPAIGKWSDGYVVLRGTWCEPIGHERLNVINRRLAEVRRERRMHSEDQPQVTA